ncbi:PREDICTED: uncharacterized protein C20orf96 homolog isoform X3 [Galeopterus variegatus]|uniref:Uncharacterized protein C20orf96 homolog isoform X3 n=1 Tax=Galeopterus variegatus TaxID=482537 RepID=A0ABM0RZ84_GALVR|nr:PREDICTED: uncharacterized protein C20orf96 homolog isoform X3 [Galeopterus variegatus]
MAHDSQNLSRPSLSGTHSTVHKFQTLDYVPWQRSKQKTKLSTLPPVREAAGHSKSRMKTLTRVQPVLHSKPTMVVTSQLRDPRELRRREQMDPGRKEATMRLMRKMLRNRRNSLRELLNHENFLTGLNRELIRTIQDMEDSTALNVRAMLQQQDILTTVIDILEWSNKKRLQQLKCELQEWEEKEKLKMSCKNPCGELLDPQPGPLGSPGAAGGAAECQDPEDPRGGELPEHLHGPRVSRQVSPDCQPHAPAAAGEGQPAGAPQTWTSSSTSLWKSRYPSRWQSRGPPLPAWSLPSTCSLESFASQTVSSFRP